MKKIILSLPILLIALFTTFSAQAGPNDPGQELIAKQTASCLAVQADINTGYTAQAQADYNDCVDTTKEILHKLISELIAFQDKFCEENPDNGLPICPKLEDATYYANMLIFELYNYQNINE